MAEIFFRIPEPPKLNTYGYHPNKKILSGVGTILNYQLSGEQRQYQELAKSFAQQEFSAASGLIDRSQSYDAALYKKAWDAGLINLLAPSEFGGLGLKIPDAGVIMEELGAGCSGFAVSCLANDIACAPLVVAGSAEQKKQFLETLVSDCRFASVSLSSQQCNLRASRVNNEYVINGTSNWTINGNRAQWHYVQAQIEGTPPYTAPTGFVISAGTPGITCGKKQTTLGWHAADLCSLSFDEVKIPTSCRIGNEGDCTQIDNAVSSKILPLIAACAVGLSRKALEHAVAYSKTRHSFGQPICNYQSVSFMLADMATDIEAARIMCRQATWLCDQDAGSPSPSSGAAMHVQSVAAKLFACNAAVRATTDAVQIFGGYGYTREYPVEKLMRDAKMFQLFFGTKFDMQAAAGKDFLHIQLGNKS